jgi:hypothetical protein
VNADWNEANVGEVAPVVPVVEVTVDNGKPVMGLIPSLAHV